MPPPFFIARKEVLGFCALHWRHQPFRFFAREHGGMIAALIRNAISFEKPEYIHLSPFGIDVLDLLTFSSSRGQQSTETRQRQILGYSFA
jgi:hypothetical protein